MGCFPEPSGDDCTDADFGYFVEDDPSSAAASCQRCVAASGEGRPTGCFPSSLCTLEDFDVLLQEGAEAEGLAQMTASCQFCWAGIDEDEEWTDCFPAGTSCTPDETTLGEGCLVEECGDSIWSDLGSACTLCLADEASGDLEALTQAHLDSCEADDEVKLTSRASAIGASAVALIVAAVFN